jgi:hypothetical protein
VVSINVVKLVGRGVGALESVEVHSFVAGRGGQELLIGARLLDGSERPLLGESENGINLLSLSG